MKWLLVTRINDNPGDAFVCLGVERLVREVDPNATIRKLCAESDAIGFPVEFDRAVWCGGPVLWSNETSHCWNIGWWRFAVEGWLSERPERLMWWAVGTYIPLSQTKPDKWCRLRRAARQMDDRSFGIYARDRHVCDRLGYDVPVVWCPSVFAARDHRSGQTRRLASLMRDGSHYRHMDPAQADAWAGKVARVRDILVGAGFTFVCHNGDDYRYAKSLGINRLVLDGRDPRATLDVYGTASKYFGCRIHGGVVSRANDADAWCIGYDTRRDMIDRLGGRYSTPEELGLDELEAWANTPDCPKELAGVETEWNRQVEAFRRFAAS